MTDAQLLNNSTRAVNRELIASLETGDIILFNRQCMKMRDPLTFSLCLAAKLQSPYDHVGVVFRADKDELSLPIREAIKRSGSLDDAKIYVVEANVTGVSVRGLVDRVTRTSSNDVAVRRLCFHNGPSPARSSTAKAPTNPTDVFAEVVQREYQTSLLGFLPSTFFPPDNAERVAAAEKMKILQVEIDDLLADIRHADGSDKVVLKKLLEDMFEARCIIAEKYFSHLPKNLVKPYVLQVDFDAPGYWIDGHNIASSRDGIFCSELVARVLQGLGILVRFPPASSFRPSDFAREGFGNYAVPTNKLLPTASLFADCGLRSSKQSSSTSEIVPAIEPVGDVLSKHLNFVTRLWRDVKAEKRPSIEADSSCVPHAWVLPAADAEEAAFALPWRLILASGTIVAASVATMPLWIRQLEMQHGTVVKGNPFVLVGLLSSRSVIATLLHCWMWIALQQWKPSSPSAIYESKSFADASHPYHSVVLPCAAYGLAAAILTYPLERAALLMHFAPVTPGPKSYRLFFRGSLTNAFLCTPYIPCAWFLWYEGAMQFVIGTPFSILRCRSAPSASHDSADFVRWRSNQLQCFGAALALTVAYEVVTYPIHTYQRRQYSSKTRPSARALFSGLQFHLARTLSIYASSAAIAWSIFL